MLDALHHLWTEMHGHMLHVLLLIVGATALFVYTALNWRRWTVWHNALELRPRKKRGNRETLLIMPDISGFSDFVLRSPSEANVGQEITLQLLDAIVRPGRGTMELAKIEGDSALLFCDADAVSPAKLGSMLLEMFRSFDAAKADLSCYADCQCGSCDHVETLELKVLVHRGITSSFEFRGVGDVFGPSVIELYRMSKTRTPLRRFVMTSKTARSSVSWQRPLDLEQVEVQLEDIGTMTVDLVSIPVTATGEETNPPITKRNATKTERSKTGFIRQWPLRKFQQV